MAYNIVIDKESDTMKKQGKRLRKTATFILIALLILTACGKEVNNDDNQASASIDNTVEEYDTLKYGVSEKLSPDPEKVTLVVPDYLCDEEIEYTVTPLNQYATEHGESKAYRYDISCDQITGELNGFIEIHIPYDESFFESGEDPAKCLAVHYTNEEGKLQLELFDVDTENKEVIIYAQHLSPREIYHYKTRKLAEKYDINFGNLIVGNVRLDDSEEVFMGFTEDLRVDSESWDSEYFEWTAEDTGNAYMLAAKLVAKPFFPVLFKWIPKNDNNLIYDTSTWISNAATMLSLGGPYVQSYINRGLSRLSVLGMYTSECKLAYELGLEDLEHRKSREEVLNLYRTFMNTALDHLAYNYAGWIEEKVAMSMSGVFVFSMLIDAMFEEAMYQKMWEMGEIYEYFGDSYTEGQYRPRTNMEWYNLFMDIIEKYCKAGKQDYVQDAIDREIYLYAIRFWSLSQEEADAVADAAGYKRRLWPTEAEQKKLTETYIENLKYRLHPIVAACQKTMQKKSELMVLNQLQDTYNNFNFKTQLKVKDGNKKIIYDGYWFSFKGLSSDADPKVWKGQLDKKGEFGAKFSITDWIVAGMPTEAVLYKTEKDMESGKNAVTSAKIMFGKTGKDESTVTFLEAEEMVWALDSIVYLDHYDDYDTCHIIPDSYCEGSDVCPALYCTAIETSVDDTYIYFDKSSFVEDDPDDTSFTLMSLKLPPSVLYDVTDIDNWGNEISAYSLQMFDLHLPDDSEFSGHGIVYQSGKKVGERGFADRWPDMAQAKTVFITAYVNYCYGFIYRAISVNEVPTHTVKHINMDAAEYFAGDKWK